MTRREGRRRRRRGRKRKEEKEGKEIVVRTGNIPRLVFNPPLHQMGLGHFIL